MRDQDTTEHSPRRSVYITSLCAFLWITAAAFTGLGIWAAVRGAVLPAGLSLAGALLLALAGFGLFQMRRWGVVAFAVFILFGAVNYFSSAFIDLTRSSGVGLLLPAINLVAAVLITLFMIYLVLLLWRSTK